MNQANPTRPRRRTSAPPTLAEVRTWPATVSVAQAAQALGISKSHLHRLIRENRAPVKVLTFGRSYRVITADLADLLTGVREAA